VVTRYKTAALATPAFGECQMAQNLGSGIATMATLALAQAAIATLAVFHVLSRLTKIGQALTPAWPAQYKQLLCLRPALS
jgi:hypothetical protein